MECHHLKGGDFLRLAPHVLCSVLPKTEDPLIEEHVNRTGLVSPQHINEKLFHLIDQNPHGMYEFHFI